ncbi:MAG TPA: hypothetical protein VFF04_04185 [Candidatus Babeliales bacterium]|nr:hypothetical protein [Candidatus Babeliales bacterium]
MNIKLLVTICLFFSYSISEPFCPKLPEERHRIQMINKNTGEEAGIIDFDFYRSKNGIYATGGTFYLKKENRGKVPVQKIFQNWLHKLPELGARKGYWRADPFEVDEHGKFMFYHHNPTTYVNELAKLISFYSAIGGKPETDAHDNILATGPSTSKGMKSVRFCYEVPNMKDVVEKPVKSYLARLISVVKNERVLHPVMV